MNKLHNIVEYLYKLAKEKFSGCIIIYFSNGGVRDAKEEKKIFID